MNPDGTASFALPRAEVGQGITTSVAMLIAEELDLPLDKVASRSPTRGPSWCSTSSPAARTRSRSLYQPVRTAAAARRAQRLVQTAAAAKWGVAAVDAHDAATASCVRTGRADGHLRVAPAEAAAATNAHGRAVALKPAVGLRAHRHRRRTASTRWTP